MNCYISETAIKVIFPSVFLGIYNTFMFLRASGFFKSKYYLTLSIPSSFSSLFFESLTMEVSDTDIIFKNALKCSLLWQVDYVYFIKIHCLNVFFLSCFPYSFFHFPSIST